MDLSAVLLSVALHFARLQAPRISETTLVFDFMPSVESPRAVTTLDWQALTTTPAGTLDDALRSVPGFSLFRRSSSRVANPTTQGATLRGLAASGSSRALVLGDGIPLNDPVGGWVYWNRVPAAALDEVSVARGASGDYGVDAVGGVISIESATRPGVRFLAEGGSDETGRLSGYGGRTYRDTQLFGAAEGFTTGGFVVVEPATRGSIDTPAGSRHASAAIGVSQATRSTFMAFRGSHFRESRKNGTPFQRNATRITQASADVGRYNWRIRPYAQIQHYEQTFSAVLGGRASERPTSQQSVGAVAFGASADLVKFRQVDFSFSARRVSAQLEETEFATSGAQLPSSLVEPSQTSLAASAHRRWNASSVSAGAGARLEMWQSRHDGANRHVFVTPRLWLTYSVLANLKANVAVQTGARGPTLNELYRPFRVGNTVTQANAQLEPERVRGIEAGISRYHPRTTVRLLGFLSRVDDAIVNVTLSTGSTIVRQRQNAARIHARGVELETETRIGAVLSELCVLTTSTSYTRSDFATGPLTGLRVPQVPRWHHAIGGRGVIGRAKWSAEWRYIDEQFDDDRNLFALTPSSMLDARVGWMVTKKIEVFGAMENVTDEEQDVGRTPIRTIGLPRTTRAGVRVVF